MQSDNLLVLQYMTPKAKPTMNAYKNCTILKCEIPKQIAEITDANI